MNRKSPTSWNLCTLLSVATAFWKRHFFMPPQQVPALATSRPRDPNLNRKLNRMRSLSPIFFLVSTLLCASALAQSSATVTTDQADYPPGGIVLITGAGFTPGELVQCQVLHIPDTG